MEKKDLKKKLVILLNFVEIVWSAVFLISIMTLLYLRNTVSYEAVTAFEKTQKSSIYIIMDNNPFLGELIIGTGSVIAICIITRNLISRQPI